MGAPTSSRVRKPKRRLHRRAKRRAFRFTFGCKGDQKKRSWSLGVAANTTTLADFSFWDSCGERSRRRPSATLIRCTHRWIHWDGVVLLSCRAGVFSVGTFLLQRRRTPWQVDHTRTMVARLFLLARASTSLIKKMILSGRAITRLNVGTDRGDFLSAVNATLPCILRGENLC